MNYYRRFPGDYARDTQHLTTLEHGIYTLLLDHLYSTERPIATLEDCFRIARTSNPVGRTLCKRVVSMFFMHTTEGYWHKRVDEEVNHLESRSNAARKSAEARWKPMRTHSERNADASTTQCSPDSRLQTKENTEIEALVDWIPLALWRNWLEMRDKLKRPLTSAGIDLHIEILRKLRDEGEDVRQVIEQAIRGGWLEFKAVRKEATNGRESFNEQRSRKSANAINSVLGRFEKASGHIHGALPPADK